MLVKTNIYDLDRKIEGIKAGELIYVGGRGGCGKTSLSLRLLKCFALEQSLPVLYFSTVNSKEFIVQRLISEVSGKEIDGVQDKEFWQKVFLSAEKVADTPIYVEDGCMAFEKILSSIRDMQHMHGIKVVIIDDVHKITAKAAEYVSALSRLAKELSFAIFLFSKIDKVSSDAKKKYSLCISDLEEGIFDSSDLILFVDEKRITLSKSKDERGLGLCNL